MNVTLADVTYVHGRSIAFEDEIPMQFLGTEWATGGAQGHAGIGRNQHFVVNSSAGGVRSGEQMGDHGNTVAAMVLVNFYFVGVQGRIHLYVVADCWFD